MHLFYFFQHLHSFRFSTAIAPKVQQFILLQLCIQELMQKQCMGNVESPQRTKTHSLRNPQQNSPLSPFSKLEFSSLSSSVDLSNQKRLCLDGLIEYQGEVIEQVYIEDCIGFKHTLRQFLKAKLGELKGKLQERLSLLKYLQGSLKYKSFGEVEAQILRQWRKNVLFFSTGTLWGRCMLAHEFKSEHEFLRQYEKFRTLIANLTHHYFRGCLKVLHGKGVDTLTLLFDDTAHQVIAGFSDWKQIYEKVLLAILDPLHKAATTCPQDSDSLLEKSSPFDLGKLRVNQHYLNPTLQANQLPQTTKLISQFSSEYRIHEKVALLKKIRTTFLSQITESSRRIQLQLGSQGSQFQKDDIIDCMIYCIVKGQIIGLSKSLKTLTLLLGKDSELLSKKGVDSYRADLQGAVQYLAQEHSMSTVENSQVTLSPYHS